jgi:hypothetical protein
VWSKFLGQALPFFKYFAFGISLELENVLSIGSSRVCKVFLPRLAHHRQSLSLHCYGTCSSSNPKSVVKVFSSRERFWRDIHCFPVHSLNCYHSYEKNNGVHLNGTINWIGLRDYMVNSM